MKRSYNQSYGRLRKPAWTKSKRARASGSVRQFVSKAILKSTEVKFKDTAIPESGQTSKLIPLNQIGQGADYNQRVGRHIKLKSLQGMLTGKGVCRYWIVYDSQPGGLVPPVYDIFEIASSDDLNINSLRNVSKWGNRFKILKTDLICTSYTSGGTADPYALNADGSTSFTQGKFYINLRGMDTEFYAGNDSTTVSSGALYICFSVLNKVTGNVRLAYLDK